MLQKFLIENNNLRVEINRKGAELCSVIDENGTEFLWQAGKEWGRHAPNLFPIVGSLLDHEFEYQGQVYSLKHHGFARDLDFDVLHQSQDSICLVLQQTAETLKSYPFKFTFLLTYTLEDNSLKQTFRVINDDAIVVPVSFGGHPAFNAAPVSDFELVFSHSEIVKSNQLTGPYINQEEIDVFDNNKIILTDSIFDNDALIFLGLKSNTVILRHTKLDYSIEVDFEQFPYLGIWSKPGAPFVCLEPWQGLADFDNHNKRIEDKKGIIMLEVGKELEKSFTMKFNS